jgi:hypothetical protein
VAPDEMLLSNGSLHATVRFRSDETEQEPQGRVLFGFDSRTQSHFSAGIGGWRALYTVEQFAPTGG